MAELVNNLDKNYSIYYNVLEYFKVIMSNHPSIASVSQGDLGDLDEDSFPRYPLGNVMVTETLFEDKTVVHSVELLIADKVKNKNNESSGSLNEQVVPFYGTNDEVDVLANTLGIVNDLTTFTQYSTQAFDINGTIQCIPFVDNYNNGLAGHIARFQLTSYADRNRCTFELVKDGELDPNTC